MNHNFTCRTCRRQRACPVPGCKGQLCPSQCTGCQTREATAKKRELARRWAGDWDDDEEEDPE